MFLLWKSIANFASPYISCRASTTLRTQCIIVGPSFAWTNGFPAKIQPNKSQLHLSQKSGKRMRGWISAQGILYKQKSKIVQCGPTALGESAHQDNQEQGIIEVPCLHGGVFHKSLPQTPKVVFCGLKFFDSKTCCPKHAES